MREYGLDLDDLYSGRKSVRAVSNAAAHLPRGGAVGEWYGGELAVPDQVAAVWENTHVLAQANSEKKIKPRELPVGVREVERTRELALAKARRYRARRGQHG
ncbi:hypothetical protein AUL38_16015 [Leucobacter sp. G161]|nr:hypothetical protein AUL38_16015 [Leucobacter sp. G161]